jgi:hypothetical protein
MVASILKPPRKLPVLFVGEGRVEVVDRNVGRRDQHRFGVRERVEAVLSVVMAHAGRPGAAERHSLDEQVDVDQVHPTPAEGQLADEAVDGLLVSAEDEARERTPGLRHARQRFVEGLVGQDRQDRTEDLVLHDLVVPGDGIEKRGVEVMRFRVRLAAGDHLGGIDERRQPGNRFRIDDARIIGVGLRIITEELD